MNFRKTTASKIAAAAVSFTMALAFVLGGSVTANAQTVEELTAQINSLLSTIASLQATLASLQSGSSTGSTTTTTGTGYVFTRNLKQGDTGEDVKQLQILLNKEVATQVAASGVGSAGSESTYFGPATKAAVIKFQNKYASEVLAPVGLSAGTGYVGAATRAKLNAMGGSSTTTGSTTTGGTTVITPTGTALTVTAGSQPAASLAVYNAARVPFTRFVLTAGASDVVVNGVEIQRAGLAQDDNFSGIVLLDENGTQMGIAKTLNSEHKAIVGGTFTVPAGTSKTYTVAGNMAAQATVHAGEVAALTVVGVNTSAAVTGSLPITGAAQTINATLSIGSVTMQRGGTDPSAPQTKEVGTAGYTFSSVRVTAGSSEKVLLQSIRWNQTGSASASDLANVKTYVDGVAYTATVSSDGKYYTTTFSPALLIDKGFSKEISIKGDINSGSSRTIAFDIAKKTDLGLMGELYGYGIIPPQTNSCGATTGIACFTSSEDPWYDGAIVTVSAGTMNVSADSAVNAQNIAINVQNQPLGGFSVDVRGEAISVGRMVFANSTSTTDITNITLVDGNGVVLAGPVDAGAGTITFTDSVTFQPGITKIQLKGKLGTTFVTNNTVQISTTPSSQWTTVTGQVTGNTLTPAPSSAITASQMTVKAGALSISESSQPSARSVIAGAEQFEFARYVFDATQSGEDIRVTSFPAKLSFVTNSPSYLTNCTLYDGSTALTTGSNVVNPSSSASSGDDITFTFDGTGLIVAKGTAKTVSLKCNVSTSATSGSFTFGNDNNASTFTAATGVTSGQTIAESWATSSGNAMTSSTGGSYTVSADSAVKYRMVQAGTSGVELAKFRFEAGTAEDVMLRQIALQLGNTASNSPADLVGQKAYIYYGSTMVGTAQFAGTNADNATTTLTSTVTLPAGESVTLTVKADLINHDANTNPTSTAGNGGYGAFVAVTYDGNNNGLNGNYGTGVDSGTTINGGTTSDVTTAGVRVFRTVPTISVIDNSSVILGASKDLYKVRVSNPGSRDIAIAKMTFSVATTGGAVTGFTLYGDGIAANGSTVEAPTGTLSVAFDSTSDAKIVPAGSSKIYALRVASAVDQASVTDTLTIALKQDTAYPSLAKLMGTVAQIEATSNDYFIWSPFSTTTPVANAASESNLDWTNSYGMPGFPALGQDATAATFSRPN